MRGEDRASGIGSREWGVVPEGPIPDPRLPTPARPRKRLGIVGTFVWDVIHGRDVRTAPVEEWGGIAYALGALDAALPDDWEIVPIIKVGAALWARAQEYLRTQPEWQKTRGANQKAAELTESLLKSFGATA